MKESDMLLSRAEKLRRDARGVRSESTRVSNDSDQQCLLDVANNLETDARDLEARATREHASGLTPGLGGGRGGRRSVVPTGR
jgi:hypothetical protein